MGCEELTGLVFEEAETFVEAYCGDCIVFIAVVRTVVATADITAPTSTSATTATTTVFTIEMFRQPRYMFHLPLPLGTLHCIHNPLKHRIRQGSIINNASSASTYILSQYLSPSRSLNQGMVEAFVFRTT
jgi:hypothetical protein